MPNLAERVQRLEDIEAIRRLKIRYARYCDDHHNPDGIASLFSKNGVWDGGKVGCYAGRAAIREFFALQGPRITFSMHYILGHAIDIDPSGHTAKGTWNLLMLATIHGRAYWLFCDYADDYVQVDGQWLFQHVRVRVHAVAPYEVGWAPI